MTRVWTVGHSNHSFERFAALIAGSRIELVADVRSRPVSRFAPWSGRGRLAAGLTERGVGYEFFGETLGGRPAGEEHYDATGHALYGRMAEDPAFGEAIDRLFLIAAERRIALMCSEGDFEGCHRRLLVGKVLCDRGAVLQHILPSGAVQSEHQVPVGSAATLFAEESWRSARPVARVRSGPGA